MLQGDFGHFSSSVNCWMVINKIGCHYFLCHVRVLFTIIFTGSGKSCLLGNWSLHHQEKFPKDAVVYHFAGCTSGSTGDNTFHCLFWLTFLTLTWRRDFCLMNRKWRKWTQCSWKFQICLCYAIFNSRERKIPV